MVGVTKEKSQRLRDLLETVYASPTGITFPSLVQAAIRAWVVSKRTAEEYVETLVAGKLLFNDPPGGPLHITPAGERWLDAGTLEPPEHEVAITKARPSPPASKPEGDGT